MKKPNLCNNCLSAGTREPCDQRGTDEEGRPSPVYECAEHTPPENPSIAEIIEGATILSDEDLETLLTRGRGPVERNFKASQCYWMCFRCRCKSNVEVAECPNGCGKMTKRPTFETLKAMGAFDIDD